MGARRPAGPGAPFVERVAAQVRDPRTRAELIAASWEIFSALLFVSAVVPSAYTTPWPEFLFLVTVGISAALGRRLVALGARGYAWAGVIRAISWPAACIPLMRIEGPRVLVAALAFGLMAGGMRRATYRLLVDSPASALDDAELRATLRARLAEAAMMAGIVGGHAMLLFSVAFLRTQSQVIFRLWFDIVPALALLGTVAFTLAVRPASRWILRGLEAGPGGEPDLWRRGLAQASALPNVLGALNFSVWFVCTGIGIVYVEPSLNGWRLGDALMQLGFGSLFAWGVAFYQRTWHRDTVAPAIERFRRWSEPDAAPARDAEPMPLRRRMLRDFGLPLLFMGTLSLFSSIGLYRTLGSELGWREDFNAISALFASFAILVMAVGGVVARAARDLSRPMTELADAADKVARGKLDAVVPPVAGPVEVVGLGESIEGMRQGLARTIAELEAERAGLERNVDARTAELRAALEELKRAQAALVQGERLASIGELVSGVAHEINNPLNAIAGASVPLEDLVMGLRAMMEAYRDAESELSPERRKALEAVRKEIDVDASLDDLVGISTVIRRAVDRSVRIVQNLRNFSRTSAEALPTDLHAALEETLMLLGPRLRQACIQVVRNFGPLPLVTCRGGEINQVFMNLLVNSIQAIEHAPGRGAEAEIHIDTWLEGDVAALAFTDSGPGVAPDLAARIFDPFFTTKPRGQGTGLGLSISTDIARRHGGSITLDPPPGGGRSSRFVCRLPVAPPASRASHPSRRSEPRDDADERPRPSLSEGRRAPRSPGETP